MRALVVDDDPASRQVLAVQLDGLGPCTLCASGPDAVEAIVRAIAAGEPFDVVFLDCIMPYMDGFETLTRIRDVETSAGLPPERQAKAILVTSMDDDPDTLAAPCDCRIAATLLKPANKTELLETLAALLLVDKN